VDYPLCELGWGWFFWARSRYSSPYVYCSSWAGFAFSCVSDLSGCSYSELGGWDYFVLDRSLKADSFGAGPT
jgi:hypothetical protein